MKTLQITEAEVASLLALAKKINNNSVVEVVKVPKGTPKVAKATSKVAKATPKSTAKAVKKAANQKLMRSINGHLATATKVAGSDPKVALQQLRAAMELVPSHWSSVALQICRKADKLGLPLGTDF